MGCESRVKFRTDNRTIVVLSLSGSDGTSAVRLPVHESLVALGMETLTDRRYAPSLRWISRIIDRRSCYLWVGPPSRWILVSLINACWQMQSRRRHLPTPASPPFFDDSPGAERPGVAGLEGCGEGVRLRIRLIPLNLSLSLSRNLRFSWSVSFEGPCMVVESKVWKQRLGVQIWSQCCNWPRM